MEDLKGLQILMQKVRNFWVKGVLEQSLQHSALVELGLTQMPGMVDSPFGSTPISPDQSLGGVFNEIGRSLLILGEPGSGKTTMLLRLAKELIVQFENEPGFPLPVIFNLSSWTRTTNDFPGWLADELSTKYLIPRKIGASWVDQNRILLLLDGLDEVGAERRNACVQAINTYLSRSAVPGVVVCCRFKEYLDLGSKLNLNGAIRLKALSRVKILQTVGDAGVAYSGLLELLKKDPSFLKLAEIPFMLNLMLRTYEELVLNNFR
jgi:DNA polymerase III delta prime subunit